MTTKRTTPREWRACIECGRRLPNRARHRRECAGCRKLAQGRPVTRWNAATHTYTEATAYIHRHATAIGGQLP